MKCTCGYAIGHPLVKSCTCKGPLTETEVAKLFDYHPMDINFKKLMADVRLIEKAHGIV